MNPLESESADLVGVCTVVTIHPVVPEHADATHCPIFTAVALPAFQYTLYFIHVPSNPGNDGPVFQNIAADIQVGYRRSSW